MIITSDFISDAVCESFRKHAYTGEKIELGCESLQSQRCQHLFKQSTVLLIYHIYYGEIDLVQ